MKKAISILFLLLSIQFISAQEQKHKVRSGETVYAIAKKYKVKEKEIFEANPSIKDKPLAIGKVLVIPSKKKQESKTEVAAIPQTHTATKGESFYSIAKKYQLKVSDLQANNPNLDAKDLKIGDVVALVPTHQAKSENVAEALPTKELVTNESTENSVTENVVTVKQNDIVHVVKSKETLYKIAKKYHTSVDQLKALNPELKKNLPIGYELVIEKGKEVVAQNTSEDATEIVEVAVPAGNETQALFLIDKASQYLGTRYRSGGTTSAGFDCSGLMCTTFKEINMELPRSSYEMARYGFKVDKTQAQKGDLIFFYTTSKSRISHVGMITEITDNDIKFIHSSTSSGVIISSLNEAYYSKRFVQISRVLN